MNIFTDAVTFKQFSKAPWVTRPKGQIFPSCFHAFSVKMCL